MILKRKSVFGFLFLGMSFLFIFSCAKRKPSWTERISWFDEKENKIYGVGVADKTKSEQMNRVRCGARARAEIAKAVETYSASLVKDFIENHRDYFNEDAEGLDEFTSSIAKEVSEATLNFATIDETWSDDKIFYCRATMRIDSKFLSNLYENMKRKIREQHRAIVKERAEEALKSLDEELKKKREAQEKGY